MKRERAIPGSACSPWISPPDSTATAAEVDPACAPSDVTVSLGYSKRGHIAFPGADFTGKLEVADIGIPPGLDSDVSLDLINSRLGRRYVLPSRPSDSHKGTYGRALIVAGSRNFLGAAYLAASAAGPRWRGTRDHSHPRKPRSVRCIQGHRAYIPAPVRIQPRNSRQ